MGERGEVPRSFREITMLVGDATHVFFPPQSKLGGVENEIDHLELP